MELTEHIKNAVERLAAAKLEWDDVQKSANAHEQQARADRLKMTELKTEIGELATQLRHQQVQKTVNDAAAETKALRAEAEKSKAEADATLARLADKENSLDAKAAELDELIAKAKSAQPAG